MSRSNLKGNILRVFNNVRVQGFSYIEMCCFQGGDMDEWTIPIVAAITSTSLPDLKLSPHAEVIATTSKFQHSQLRGARYFGYVDSLIKPFVSTLQERALHATNNQG